MEEQKKPKTATAKEDEILARRIWRMHEELKYPPLKIAKLLGVDRTIVNETLTGRRLGPAKSDYQCAPVRCPYCGKRVYALPCLACRLEGQDFDDRL